MFIGTQSTTSSPVYSTFCVVDTLPRFAHRKYNSCELIYSTSHLAVSKWHRCTTPRPPSHVVRRDQESLLCMLIRSASTTWGKQVLDRGVAACSACQPRHQTPPEESSCTTMCGPTFLSAFLQLPRSERSQRLRAWLILIVEQQSRMSICDTDAKGLLAACDADYSHSCAVSHSLTGEAHVTNKYISIEQDQSAGIPDCFAWGSFRVGFGHHFSFDRSLRTAHDQVGGKLAESEERRRRNLRIHHKPRCYTDADLRIDSGSRRHELSKHRSGNLNDYSFGGVDLPRPGPGCCSSDFA